jgi:molybdopterin-guanine dinucleotide biosynthesis protein A
MIRDSYGLVLCGGKSTRMKTDKSTLTYFGRPQWQQVYEMLHVHCTTAFISCSGSQEHQFGKEYPLIIDDTPFQDCGPIASLLSAFAKFPDRDLFIAGCDYPFLSSQELDEFFSSSSSDHLATAFFNEMENVYEPVLGWYSHRSRMALMERFFTKKYSLQKFLLDINAKKYFPHDINSMISVDTPELMHSSIIKLNRTYAGGGE